MVDSLVVQIIEENTGKLTKFRCRCYRYKNTERINELHFKIIFFKRTKVTINSIGAKFFSCLNSNQLCVLLLLNKVDILNPENFLINASQTVVQIHEISTQL